jgi:pilus assembly protein CpaB
MNVKKIVPLVGALALGLVAARLVMHMLQNNNTAKADSGPHTVNVVVASQDIPPGNVLSDDDLTTNKFADASKPTDSFDDPSGVVTRVSAGPIVKGQVIVESLLAPNGSGSGLQAVIPSGMRAVTVDVNEVSGVAGYVTPGCRVDIVQTFHDDVSNQPVARCVAQNVEVTAIGTRQSLGTSEEAHSVTLLVTPRQAETIELASANGRPRLVLRGWRDQSTAETPMVSLSDLTGDSIPLPRTPIAVDPFAATTRPSVAPEVAATNKYRMRVIAAGEESYVNVNLPRQSPSTAVTGTSDQIKDATTP